MLVTVILMTMEFWIVWKVPNLNVDCRGKNSITHLSPLKHDTDGDGKADNRDIHPGFAPDDGEQSQVANYYEYMRGMKLDDRVDENTFAHLLGMFLDRDDDGLYDAKEDFNMDGNLDTPERGDNMSLDDYLEEMETDPLDRDTDGDGVGDKIEVDVWKTNPRSDDTDMDGISDGDELAYGVDSYDDVAMPTNFDVRSGKGCDFDRAIIVTNPLNPDTDGDGLLDGDELTGDYYPNDVFLDNLNSNQLFGGGGIDIRTNPLSGDSDNDGIPDGIEYNGTKINFLSSNPCMVDSDDDGLDDKDELRGCQLAPTGSNCEGIPEDAVFEGNDWDADGLPNDKEELMGTDPYNRDSDGDTLLDGEEDLNRNGVVDVNETDPRPETGYDTDNDGLHDGLELKGSLGTDPLMKDSDGDGCADGIEDKNKNGRRDPDETDPSIETGFDTDGDGLADCDNGRDPCEDCDNDGVVTKDANGNATETDPLNWDSDYDGASDGDEVMRNGYIQGSTGRALSPDQGACSLNSNNTLTPSGLILLIPLLLLVFMKKISPRREEETVETSNES